MSIRNEIIRIKNAKSEIIKAIKNKGSDIPDSNTIKIDEIATLIGEIKTGTDVLIEKIEIVIDGEPTKVLASLCETRFTGLTEKPYILIAFFRDPSILPVVLLYGNEVNGLNDTGIIKGTAETDATFSITSDHTCIKQFITLPSPAKVSNYLAIMKNPLGDYDPVLANNTWEKIVEASEKGVANLLWNIGDEYTFPGDDSWGYPELTVQIAGFNHDDLADGSGKAGITFVYKNSISDEDQSMHNTHEGYPIEYEDTDLYKTGLDTIIYSDFRNELIDSLKTVNKKVGTTTIGSTTLKTLRHQIFPLSEVEVFGRKKYSVGTEGEQYPLFKDEENIGTWWGLRSPCNVDVDISMSGTENGIYCCVGNEAPDVTVPFGPYQSWRFGFCV